MIERWKGIPQKLRFHMTGFQQLTDARNLVLLYLTEVKSPYIIDIQAILIYLGELKKIRATYPWFVFNRKL